MGFDWNNYVAYEQYNDSLIDDFCEVLANCDDPEDYNEVRECARCVGISLSSLSEEQKEHINQKVNELREGY